MKIKYILALVLLMVSLGIHAQSLWDRSKPDNNFTFGVRAGANFASTDMDYATSTRTGFHVGGIVDWNIVKSISVQSGIYYVEKGFKSDFGKGRSGYVQIPLLASYHIETPTKVQFHFNVGPYFAWGVTGRVDYNPYDETFSYNFNQNSFGQKGFFKHFDMGLCAGASILISHVILGVNYEHGFMDIAKVYGKFHNRNVCITAGYNF